MQLIGLLLLFHLAEGWLRLPPGAVRFERVRAAWRASGRRETEARDGWLPLRPGRLAFWAAPWPFELQTEGVRSTAPIGRLGLRAPRAAAPLLRFEDLARVEASGLRVKLRGRSLLRALSRPHARAAARLLARLGRAEPASRLDELDRALRSAASPVALRERAERAHQALRTASRICDGYGGVLLATLPAMLAFEESAVLLAAAPLLLVLHVAALWCVRAAHAALQPDDAAERREMLFAAALFPPTLLRLPQRIFLAAVGVPAPASAAVALLDGAERIDRLRRALAEAELDPRALPGERDRVLALAAEAGLDPARLREPPRGDAASVAYCPLCFESFAFDAARCADCDVALRPYADPAR